MPKRLILMLALVFVLVFASSCGDNSNGQQAVVNTETPTPVATPVIVTRTPAEPSETPVESITPTPEPEPEPEEEFIFPDPNIRPVSVMIDNQGDRVLPQGGIAQAQIVYEILTEYNITRYMLFFWGTMPDMIGPVRSARHYFLDYAMEYDAVYTHFGWSEYAQRDIAKLKINNINFDSAEAFWDLTSDKNNWQDTYTSRERIEKAIKKLKYATTPKKTFPFTYHSSFTVPDGGSEAKDIFMKFSTSGVSTCGYVYDDAKGLYARQRMGKPHMERNTGKQLMVRNIIITEIASPLIAGDQYGRINLSNIGTGSGWYITGGKAVKIKWKKDSRDAQTSYLDESGNPIVLNPGQTWIEIVPKLSLVEIK